MSYKVLYRKYRPTNFSDIIDQKFITDTLKESIINNKISHAYLFSGPKGTGKTSTAKVFAKAINCENPIDGEPCEKCSSCLNFESNPDVIELDAASNNKVEDIREIINNVKLTPTNSKFKIYIIDEVHMLTNSASNAFLLTLEEPPSHAIFILATTNPESLPLTILSRCQQFAFSKISADVFPLSRSDRNFAYSLSSAMPCPRTSTSVNSCILSKNALFSHSLVIVSASYPHA
jgi:DNA polymerase-3 subunit gamma/tau